MTYIGDMPIKMIQSQTNPEKPRSSPVKKSLPHDAYEELADYYNALVETKPHNAYYDRPAVQSLIPDVTNKHILDAGCGPGVYAEWLLKHGASVTGIDASEKMLAHARQRVGDKATLIHANLEEPLACFVDNTFDGILSALAVTYIRDQHVLFKEFYRILRAQGWFVFSTEHPFFAYRYFKIENYFQTQQVETDWVGFEKIVKMPSYYHSLGSITGALTSNGFVIERILEPKPTDDFKEADPDDYDKLMRFPLFICIRARKI